MRALHLAVLASEVLFNVRTQRIFISRPDGMIPLYFWHTSSRTHWSTSASFASCMAAR